MQAAPTKMTQLLVPRTTPQRTRTAEAQPTKKTPMMTKDLLTKRIAPPMIMPPMNLIRMKPVPKMTTQLPVPRTTPQRTRTAEARPKTDRHHRRQTPSIRKEPRRNASWLEYSDFSMLAPRSRRTAKRRWCFLQSASPRRQACPKRNFWRWSRRRARRFSHCTIGPKGPIFICFRFVKNTCKQTFSAHFGGLNRLYSR